MMVIESGVELVMKGNVMVGIASLDGEIIILEGVKWEEIKLGVGNVVVEREEITLKVGDVVVGWEGIRLDVSDVPRFCDWPVVFSIGNGGRVVTSACSNEVVTRLTDEEGPTSKDEYINGMAKESGVELVIKGNVTVGIVSSDGETIILEVGKWEEIKLGVGNVVVEWEEITLEVGDVVVEREGKTLDVGDVPRFCDWPVVVCICNGGTFVTSACNSEVVTRSTDEVAPTSKDEYMNGTVKQNNLSRTMYLEKLRFVINMYKLLGNGN